MTWFSNLKVAHKICAGIGACFLLMILLAVVSMDQMHRMNQSSKRIVQDAVAGETKLANLLSAPRRIRTMEYAYLFANNDKERAHCLGEIKKELDNALVSQSDYQTTVHSQDNADLFDKVKAAWAAYAAMDATLVADGQQHKIDDARALIDGPMRKQVHTFTDALSDLKAWNDQHAITLGNEADATYAHAMVQSVVILVVALIVSLLIAASVARYIGRNIGTLSERMSSLENETLASLETAVNALAKGDLTATAQVETEPVRVTCKDEFGHLGETLNAMIGKVTETIRSFGKAQASLSRLIGDAALAAESLGVTSKRLAASNQDLANRTTEQASNLEETAASMEEMTGTVKATAENAGRANRLAVDAKHVAIGGGAVVSSAVTSMYEIGVASRRINDIISVIDEIAFQTNLLALNAAVEAARVGEQGRGFAVVASEVRSLAGRSSTAAKEIKALVYDSVRKVEEGTEHVNRSGEQLESIVGAVTKVADIVADISGSSSEQAQGIEQVNRAVIEMDRITQHNVGIVEDAAETSRAMLELSERLRGVVSQFKVAQEHRSYQETQVVEPQATGTYGAPSASGTRLRIAEVAQDYEEF